MQSPHHQHVYTYDTMKEVLVLLLVLLLGKAEGCYMWYDACYNTSQPQNNQVAGWARPGHPTEHCRTMVARHSCESDYTSVAVVNIFGCNADPCLQCHLCGGVPKPQKGRPMPTARRLQQADGSNDTSCGDHELFKELHNNNSSVLLDNLTGLYCKVSST
jgi:hypothetical protein